MPSIESFNGVTPTLGARVFVHPSASVIGQVSIGSDSSLWPMSVARGDVHSIHIGKRTNIQDGSVLHVTSDNPFTPGGYPLTIGNDVTVGHGAILHACTIEDFCLIGMGATILDGAILPAETMVAAGSLVPPGKKLEGGFLWVGSPVRKARPLTDKEHEYLVFSADHYVSLKNDYLSSAQD